MRGEWKIKARKWFETESWFFDLTTRNYGRGMFGGTVFFLCYKCIITTYWLTLWVWRLIDFHIGNGIGSQLNSLCFLKSKQKVSTRLHVSGSLNPF